MIANAVVLSRIVDGLFIVYQQKCPVAPVDSKVSMLFLDILTACSCLIVTLEKSGLPEREGLLLCGKPPDYPIVMLNS